MLSRAVKKTGCHIVVLAWIVSVSFLAEACAQESNATDYRQSIDGYVRDIPSSSVKSQMGSVGITESESEYNVHLKAFGKLPIELSVDSKYIGLNNSTAVDLPPHLTGFTTLLGTTLPFFNLEKTYFRTDLLFSFFGDQWTFGRQNFRFSGRYILIYKPSDQWTLVAGIRVSPRYDSPVTGLGGFIYNPNDKWSFYLVPDRPRVTYALTKRLTVFVEGGAISDDEYVVKKDSGERAILRYDEWHLGPGVLYQINKNAVLSLSGGVIFNHVLKYTDAAGKVAMDSGPYVELRLKIEI